MLKLLLALTIPAFAVGKIDFKEGACYDLPIEQAALDKAIETNGILDAYYGEQFLGRGYSKDFLGDCGPGQVATEMWVKSSQMRRVCKIGYACKNVDDYHPLAQDDCGGMFSEMKANSPKSKFSVLGWEFFKNNTQECRPGFNARILWIPSKDHPYCPVGTGCVQEKCGKPENLILVGQAHYTCK